MPQRRHPDAALGALLALFGLLAGLGDARAAEEDAVAVLPAGGTAHANVYSLDGSGDDVNARRTGRIRLVADELAPLVFTDFKLARERQRLLADAGDRGVMVTDADASEDYAISPTGRRPGVVSASVAGYGPRGVERMLYAVSSDQTVVIHGRRVDGPLWREQLVDPPITTNIVQVIALPDHRVAVAANWPSEQAGLVDVFSLDPTNDDPDRQRFAGTRPSNDGDNIVVDDRLTRLRDIFGTTRRHVAVATAEQLLELNVSTGEVERLFSVTEAEDVHGDLSAVVKLESGRYVVTTVEPGDWTRPHPNHAIHWLGLGTGDVVASVEGLERAPLEIETHAGHGASGTLGFEPDLDFTILGSIQTLQLGEALGIRPSPPRRGTAARATATLTNNGRRAILLRRAEIVAAPTACPPTEDVRVLTERTDTAVSTGSSLSLSGTFRLDASAPAGSWCAAVRVESDDGQSKRIGPTTTFELPERTGGSDAGSPSVADPVDLDLRYYGDAGDTGGAPTPDLPGRGGDGCGCRTRSDSSPLPLALFGLLAGVALAVRRRV